MTDEILDWTDDGDPPEGRAGAQGAGSGPGSHRRANRRSSRKQKRSDMPPSPGAKPGSPSRRHRTQPAKPPAGKHGAGRTVSPQPVAPTSRSARRAAPAQQGKHAATKPASAASRSGDGGRRAGMTALGVVGGIVAAAVLLWVVAVGVNQIARWYAASTADSVAQTRRSEQAKENVLVIGLKDGRAIGFIAARTELKTRRIFGIAIPEGAFVEVPGQGFERIGDSYATGADTAKSAVSNYLAVPFDRYIAVSQETYQAALQNQSLHGITKDVQATDMNASDLQVFGGLVDAIPTKDVAIVPLPVKPIMVGTERFFQPQKQQVADLLKTWWGVDVKADDMVRVIVENGIGQPGVAGEAAKQLIAAGFSVVDTKNAPKFGYDKTLIVLYRGPASNAERVKKTLNAGEIRRASSAQNLTDIIVIVGKDYVPPAAKK